MKELDPLEFGMHDSNILALEVDYKKKIISMKVDLVVDDKPVEDNAFEMIYEPHLLQFYGCSNLRYETDFQPEWCAGTILQFEIKRTEKGKCLANFLIGEGNRIEIECEKISKLSRIKETGVLPKGSGGIGDVFEKGSQ